MAETTWARLRGLIGRKRFDDVLMLAPCNDIHTFGMRRAIDIAFVSPEGMVIEAHRGISPCKRLRNHKAAAVLERFATEQPWFAEGDLVQGNLTMKEDGV